MAIWDIVRRLVKGECGELYDELETIHKRRGEIEEEIRSAVLNGRLKEAQEYGRRYKELHYEETRVMSEIILKCTRPYTNLERWSRILEPLGGLSNLASMLRKFSMLKRVMESY